VSYLARDGYSIIINTNLVAWLRYNSFGITQKQTNIQQQTEKTKTINFKLLLSGTFSKLKKYFV